MSLTEPTDSKWAPWFWLTVILVTISSVVAVAVFLLWALWKGM